MGRPSSYTPAVADIICDRLASGMGLEQACAPDDMPGARTVHRWLENNDEFRQKYARARTEQADRDADDVVKIADEECDPQRARVRVDARKWRASKLAPKKYGERIEHSGSIGLEALVSQAGKIIGE